MLGLNEQKFRKSWRHYCYQKKVSVKINDKPTQVIGYGTYSKHHRHGFVFVSTLLACFCCIDDLDYITFETLSF